MLAGNGETKAGRVLAGDLMCAPERVGKLVVGTLAVPPTPHTDHVECPASQQKGHFVHLWCGWRERRGRYEEGVKEEDQREGGQGGGVNSFVSHLVIQFEGGVEGRDDKKGVARVLEPQIVHLKR